MGSNNVIQSCAQMYVIMWICDAIMIKIKHLAALGGASKADLKRTSWPVLLYTAPPTPWNINTIPAFCLDKLDGMGWYCPTCRSWVVRRQRWWLASIRLTHLSIKIQPHWNHSSFVKTYFAPMFPFHPIEEDKASNQANKEASDDHKDGDDGGLGAADVAGIPNVVLSKTRLTASSQTRVVRAHSRTRWVLVGETSLAQLAWWKGFCHLK